MQMEIFKKEYKVRAIGGKLESLYYDFRKDILHLNENYVPFFALLGFKIEDRDILIKALEADDPMRVIKNLFIEYSTENVKEGKLKLEKVLSKKTLAERDETPEEREKRIERETHRALLFRFKDIRSTFIEKYKPSPLYYHREGIKILQGALTLTIHGLGIDVDKFIQIAGDYMEAKGSTTSEEHQEVADTINRFFNGAFPITQKELERYFTIDYGLVKPNPKAINRESYMRLGFKGKVKVKIKK